MKHCNRDLLLYVGMYVNWIIVYEPNHEKTGFLLMKSKAQTSFIAQLINVFVVDSTIPLPLKSEISSF